MIRDLFDKHLNDGTVDTVLTNEEYNFSICSYSSSSSKTKLVFTDGLSSNEQQVKIGFEKYRKIELYFCLPDYIEIDKNHWSVQWLIRIAQVPQKFDTWFGAGDTIPAGNPPEELFDRFPANHFMLVEPMVLKSFFDQESFVKSGIMFLGLLPIEQKELDYKLRNSWTVLLKKLENKGITEKVDEFRSSVCRKRFFIF